MRYYSTSCGVSTRTSTVNVLRNRLVQQLAEVARRYPEDAALQAVVGPIVPAITGPCAEVAELEARCAEARQDILRLRGQLARLAARGR